MERLEAEAAGNRQTAKREAEERETALKGRYQAALQAAQDSEHKHAERSDSTLPLSPRLLEHVIVLTDIATPEPVCQHKSIGYVAKKASFCDRGDHVQAVSGWCKHGMKKISSMPSPGTASHQHAQLLHAQLLHAPHCCYA